MRRKLLGAAAVGLGIFTLGYLAINATPEKQYVPRESGEAMEAAGAIEYLHKLRANQITGKIDQSDVNAALLALNQLATYNKTDALGLNWESRGPDNRGGRTRAFLIDKNDRNTLYIASVAGGIFKSTNGGLSWFAIADGLDNIAFASLAQAPNGDLYAGTGEGMYATVSPGAGTATSPGMTGGGLYKSTDGGVTWTVLSSTLPPVNNPTNDWSNIGALGVDPSNSSRVYAGTNAGLRKSDDGGTTWTNPVGQSGVCTDLSVGTDGSVWANLAGRTFFSPNGDAGTWSEISKNAASSTELPRSSGRQKYAISAQDPNTVYCVTTSGQTLDGLYVTYNRGATWELIQEKTTLFDPIQGQANWNLALAVSPHDKNHIFLGGIRIWEWKKVTGWRQVDFQGIPIFDVHSDKHTVTWDPVFSNIIYVTTDGGIQKSSDGGLTWQYMDKNYATTQFYHLGIGHDRKIVGGTQDNGSWLIGGNGNTPNAGTQLGAVDNFSGDGFQSYISWLDPDQYFTEYQNGRMGRSENGGQSFTSFWDTRMTAGNPPGTGNWSSWCLPYYLYETINDTLSTDFVNFQAFPASKSEGFPNGATQFVNTLTKQQASAQFNAQSFKVVSGSLTIVSDSQGNLSGDGTGTFNAATGSYDITFTTKPLAEVVITCNVSYPAGSVIRVGSNINAIPFNYTLPVTLQPLDSIKIQDPVQSLVVAGLRGSVWMTRMAHNWSDPVKWWKIADLGNGTAQSIEMSADGSYVWVGTESGAVVRISNVNLGRSLDSADVDQGANPLVSYSPIINFSGRNVTNIAVDPNNPDRVAITLGNYGNTAYIYYSENATSASPTFVSKQGTLPRFPVYSVSFDKANPNYLIIGTEYGVFTTDDITAASPSWTEENNGMPRTPVFFIKQYRTGDSSPSLNNPVYEGDLFIATHGRGFYRSTDLQTVRPVSVKEEAALEFSDANTQLQLFPNPASEFTNVRILLQNSSDVTVFVRDINGRLVKQMKLSRMSIGKHEIRINTSDLASGTYILNMQFGNQVKSGKFVVTN